MSKKPPARVAFLRLVDQLAAAEMFPEIGFASELLGVDAKGPGGVNVAFNVVSEEAFAGQTPGVRDRGSVNAVFRLHGLFSVRERLGVKMVEDRIMLAEPAEVKLIGVR